MHLELILLEKKNLLKKNVYKNTEYFVYKNKKA